MMPIDISDLFTEIYRSDENLDFATWLKPGDDEIPLENTPTIICVGFVCKSTRNLIFFDRLRRDQRSPTKFTQYNEIRSERILFE